jgi:hypothetical protein
VILPSEYVEYASESGTQIASVATAAIAERINTFLVIISLLSSASVDGFHSIIEMVNA